MANWFADLQAALIVIVGPSIMWISVVSVATLFVLAALFVVLRFLRRFI